MENYKRLFQADGSIVPKLVEAVREGKMRIGPTLRKALLVLILGCGSSVSLIPAAPDIIDRMIESLMPSGFTDAVSRVTDWTITIRQTGSYSNTKETWVKIEKPYDGDAKAIVRIPFERSIVNQIENLVTANPSRSVTTADIQIEECHTTSKKDDALSKYVSEVPSLRFSELSEGLVLDATTYEIWFQANYGNAAYIRYRAGPNDLFRDSAGDAPAIKWGKEVMRLLLTGCKEFKKL